MFRTRQEPNKATGVLDRQEVAEARAAARRGEALLPIVLSCLLVALALLMVWQRLRVVQLGYVLSTATKLERRLEQTNRELKLELGSLTAPDRVETMARKRLGLKDPERKQVVVVP